MIRILLLIQITCLVLRQIDSKEIEFTKSDIQESSIREIEEGRFLLKMKNSLKEPEFRCGLGGGRPLAIWSIPEGEIIDSTKPIKPIYVEDGFTASTLRVEKHIQLNIQDLEFLHIGTQNPGNGGIVAYIYREGTPFYVNTSVFSMPFSKNSDQTVINFQVECYNEETDTTKVKDGGPIPKRCYKGSNIMSMFVYEWLNHLELMNIAWDQKVKWTDYYTNDVGDIVYRMSPKQIEDMYIGYGFWICGDEHESEISKRGNLNGEKYSLN